MKAQTYQVSRPTPANVESLMTATGCDNPSPNGSNLGHLSTTNQERVGRVSALSSKSKQSAKSSAIGGSRGSCPSDMIRLNLNQIDLGATLDLRRGSKNPTLDSETLALNLPTLSSVPTSQLANIVPSKAPYPHSHAPTVHGRRKLHVRGSTTNRQPTPDITRPGPDALVSQLLR